MIVYLIEVRFFIKKTDFSMKLTFLIEKILILNMNAM